MPHYEKSDSFKLGNINFYKSLNTSQNNLKMTPGTPCSDKSSVYVTRPYKCSRPVFRPCLTSISTSPPPTPTTFRYHDFPPLPPPLPPPPPVIRPVPVTRHVYVPNVNVSKPGSS